jgi:hypothetical protein
MGKNFQKVTRKLNDIKTVALHEENYYSLPNIRQFNKALWDDKLKNVLPVIREAKENFDKGFHELSEVLEKSEYYLDKWEEIFHKVFDKYVHFATYSIGELRSIPIFGTYGYLTRGQTGSPKRIATGSGTRHGPHSNNFINEDTRQLVMAIERKESKIGKTPLGPMTPIRKHTGSKEFDTPAFKDTGRGGDSKRESVIGRQSVNLPSLRQSVQGDTDRDNPMKPMKSLLGKDRLSRSIDMKDSAGAVTDEIQKYSK